MQKILNGYKTTKTLLIVTEWTTTILAILFILDILYRIAEPSVTLCLTIISLGLYMIFKRHLKHLKKSLYNLLLNTDKIKVETKLIKSYTLEDLKALSKKGEKIDLATYTENSLYKFTKNSNVNPQKIIENYPNLDVLNIYETTSKLTIKTYGFNDILSDINEFELIRKHEYKLKEEVKE